MRESRHIGSFRGRFEDGRSVVIDVFQEFFGSANLAGTSSRHDGLKELVTSDGQHLAYVGKGEYRLVATGERVTSDAPDAP